MIPNPSDNNIVDFNNPIWNIEIYDENSLLIETRNADLMCTEYFIFDISKNEIIRKILLNESFQTGIEEILNDFIIFHKRENLDDIPKSGFIIYQVSQKKVIKEFNSPNYSINDNMLLYKENDKDQRVTLTDQKTRLKTSLDIYKTPVFYEKSNSHYPLVSSFLINEGKLDLKFGIEYFENEKIICFSYYLCEEGQTNNYLYIINHDGEMIANMILQRECKGAGIGTFFEFKNRIISSQHKNKLLIFGLD